VLAGLAIGALLSGMATSVMFEVLPNLEAAQRWVSAVPVVVLALVAAAAAIIPARRAVALAPTAALRAN
jgi:ABC-type lipoprotein release transport system permease subunit